MKNQNNTIPITEVNQQNIMRPVNGALFEIAIGVGKLLVSQDKNCTQFLVDYMSIADKNEALSYIIGTLEDLEDNLIDFEPIPCGLEEWGKQEVRHE